MSFPRFDSDLFIALEMSFHQASAKARSSKCRHFCYPFDTHNYCPTCRESGKRDDPCVTNQSPCNICDSSTEEQQIKIKHGRPYIRKQKTSDHNTKSITKMILTCWLTMVMLSLALRQTLRVLLKICFLHLHIPNPCVLNLCH